jgi:Domain of unknown function (DUF1877)
MGMVVSLSSVRDETIERLLADPPLVWQLIAPDDPDAYDRARREAEDRTRPGLFSRLFGGRKQDTPSTPAPALELADDEGELGDLDKSWHGIHYLLTGQADESGTPLEFLAAGGTFVGDDDVGYGPPRAFTSSETRAIAAALAAVSDDELRSRFAPEAMMRAEIYPEIWDRDPCDDDTLGYLMEYVAVLRTAMATVTSRGHGLLVVLS